jgi:hypothetical protein
LTPEQFRYASTNDRKDRKYRNDKSDGESLKVYNRYTVPGPDHVLFQAAFADFNPDAATAVDFENNRRTPLLISGKKLRGAGQLQALPRIDGGNRVPDFPERRRRTSGHDGGRKAQTLKPGAGSHVRLTSGCHVNLALECVPGLPENRSYGL